MPPSVLIALLALTPSALTPPEGPAGDLPAVIETDGAAPPENPEAPAAAPGEPLPSTDVPTTAGADGEGVEPRQGLAEEDADEGGSPTRTDHERTEDLERPDEEPERPEGPEVEMGAPASRGAPRPAHDGRRLFVTGVAATAIGTVFTIMGAGFAIATTTASSKGERALRGIYSGIGFGVGVPGLAVGIPSLTIGLRRVRAYKAWKAARHGG